MARSRSSTLECILSDILAFLGWFPWWGSLLAGTFLFVLFEFGIPALWTGPTEAEMAPMSDIGRLMEIAYWGSVRDLFLTASQWVIAPLLSLFGVMAALKTLWIEYRRNRLFYGQSGRASIRELSWQEFEQFVGEMFRRQGYVVEERGSSQPDGGVDLILRKGTERRVCQCKHWKTDQVGVAIVRELLGVVLHHGASHGYLVTSGTVTHEARMFAKVNPLTILDGADLETCFREIKTPLGQTSGKGRSLSGTNSPVPNCPRCQSPMVLRAPRGEGPSRRPFYGCSRYPSCRGIVTVT